MSETGEWAGGPDDKERKWNKLDNALYWADWVFGNTPPDLPQTKVDEVNEAARAWKRAARQFGLEYDDPKSDAEAFAMPQWAPLLGYLRGLGLPLGRIRSLARGRTGGGPFESLCFCDADEDGKIEAYRVTVVPSAVRLPAFVCDCRSSRGEVPDSAAWVAGDRGFVKATARSESKPVIKEGRFTGNVFGRAIASKVNKVLDMTRWATVWAGDPATAEAVGALAVKEDSTAYKAVWFADGERFVYVSPSLLAGTESGKNAASVITTKLARLQQRYAEAGR